MGKGSLREKKERHEQIIDCLRSEKYWTSERLCNQLDISYRSIMRDLAELKEDGVVEVAKSALWDKPGQIGTRKWSLFGH